MALQTRIFNYLLRLNGGLMLPEGAGIGKVLVSNSEGKGEWKAIAIRVPTSYAIPGEVKAKSWPVTSISLSETETEQKLVKIKYKLKLGTSVLCEFQKNGSPIEGLTELEATSEWKTATGFTGLKLVENDELMLVTSKGSGGPKELTFEYFIDHIF